MKKQLTHFDEKGNTRMVDVGGKQETLRVAIAHGHITARPETLQRIAEQKMKKGDVLEVARLAGIMAAKRTGELIPLCHPLALTSIRVELAIAADTPRNRNSSRSPDGRAHRRRDGSTHRRIRRSIDCLRYV